MTGDVETDPHDRDVKLAAVLDDLATQAGRGEIVNLESAASEHPEIADDLKELWGAVMFAEAIGAAAKSLPEETAADSRIFDEGRPPRVWGDYELLEELGRGGMGVVYRARQRSLNRDVAVKMMIRGQSASDAERLRFQAEAEAAAALQHPQIVPVYEVGVWDERPYFTMKLVQGETLSARLARGPMSGREAAELLLKVTRAIEHAHQVGVLHRDLKPSNILIDAAGQPHITDFGLAKQMADAETLTRTGAILGTPSYMSPEQAAGDRGNVGPASDVYSLGTILYHMLTGRAPFQAASPVDIVLMVLEQDPAPPSVLNPTADADLEMIALRCLQKPPELRYATAAALADDLDAYLQDESIAARSGRFADIVANVFRETHHAVVLQNWGLLWMWHSLALLIISFLTQALHWYQDEMLGREVRWPYIMLWTVGLGAWAAVFWFLRRRIGPVTFVERQIAHVWAASMVSIALLFPIEWLLGFDVLKLSPVIGLISGMVFLVKAGILSGQFYVQSIALFCCALGMALLPDGQHLLFGLVAAACFFIPGLQYYRQRKVGKEETLDEAVGDCIGQARVANEDLPRL